MIIYKLFYYMTFGSDFNNKIIIRIINRIINYDHQIIELLVRIQKQKTKFNDYNYLDNDLNI